MKLKKYILVIGLITSMSIATVSNTAMAESTENDINIVELKNAILGLKETDTKYDINQDSIINVFDLVQLKDSILVQEPDNNQPVTADYSATSDYVKLMGRNYLNNDITWLVQSGSAVEFTVTGTSAEITLEGDNSIHSNDTYKSRYAVYVDGELIKDSLMSTKQEKIQLFDSSKEQTADVKVIHLSEANNGSIGVSNISVTSASKTPIRPISEKDLKIEFIGDSITCGYGVEASSQYESFTTSTENFMKSYAYLTAEKLNADYSAVSYSGYGVISGYTSGDKNTDSLVPDYYSLIGKGNAYSAEWDFESNPNDVVVLNLGTNDYSYLSSDFEGRSADFIVGYTEFLKTIRAKNPNSYIICTIGIMGCEEVYDLIEQSVADFQTETGDTNIMSFLFPTQKPKDGYGADWHPSAVTQQMSSYILADKICEALGFESDKVGLDAVENANYDVFINSGAGANASSYVGYDKSFWINIVSGGSQSSDIQAYLQGIELTEGTYKLEFDYTSGINSSIPFFIEGSESQYYNDILNSTSTVSHYEDTFSMTEKDDCRLVFNLGGINSFNVTFSNITLIKMS